MAEGSDGSACGLSYALGARSFGDKVELGPKYGPPAKVYNGADYPARGRGRTMVKKRRLHTVAYKFRVALEALEGNKTISQLSREHEIHANLIRACKRQLLEDGPNVFATNGERKQREQEAQEAILYEQFGRLKMEVEWLKENVARSDS